MTSPSPSSSSLSDIDEQYKEGDISPAASQVSKKSGLKVTLKLGKVRLQGIANGDLSRESSVVGFETKAGERGQYSQSAADSDLEGSVITSPDDYANADADSFGEIDDNGEQYVSSEISRNGTPDPSRMTKRQRGKIEEYNEELMALPTDRLKRKAVTQEEQALKRTEMARRRKHLTDKRVEEEKMDTINRLLRKQAAKSRKPIRAGDSTPAQDDGGPAEGLLSSLPGTPAKMSRWISSADGLCLAIPSSWLSNTRSTFS